MIWLKNFFRRPRPIMRKFSKIKKGSLKKKRRNRMIALCTGLLLVIGASVKIAHSVVIPRFKKLSFFQFKKIVMNETPHITQTELQSSLNVPFGKNIFDLDLADIKKQLKKHPWLLDANITRIFPDRVNIEVFEKKPVAILSLGGLFFLDEDGRRIAR